MTTTLVPMRWWHIAEVMPLEASLFAEEAWTEAMLWAELAQSSSRHFVVAEEDGDILGYAGLCAFDEEAHVQTIGVRRDRQGEGIGTALLRDLLAEADRRDLSTVLLEVRAGNTAARRLYLRHGFRQIGVRRRYYRSGADAVVMARE
ncbi:ribosomal protein S18-alanine N-acetyltransferase [soil metagenome]